MRLLTIVFLLLFFSSCSNSYEQSYQQYSDLEKANGRLQSWFPDLVGNDCFDLKEIHTIGDIESYGKFSYHNEFRIDSLVTDPVKYIPISTDSLKLFLRKFKDLDPPKWFIGEAKFTEVSIYKKEFTYFIKDKKEKTIYFAYTMK